MRFIYWALQHRIIIALYPPHSIHRLQPLDVSLFGPLAQYYSEQLVRWIQDTQSFLRLTKRDFFGLFWKLWKLAYAPSNIASGWAKTRLYPFNAEIVLALIIPRLKPPQERLDLGNSGSSTSSNLGWRTTRSIAKEMVDQVLNDRLKKATLANTRYRH
jgi:DDE superfamily endonuclease